MSAWTKERLERMIAAGVEESTSVEYKRAAALDRTDGQKTIEITRDISAFANSAGGILIYGLAESNDKAKRPLPERLDPVRRTEVSKEWLEQIIQTIQPRIEGVVIHPVIIDKQASLVCYVVEVPQSHTAHQARDHVYYRRHNFNRLPMEDYEVRDVLNRKTHPKIRASIFVNKGASRLEPKGVILVRLENVGRVLARDVMVELELPIDMAGPILPVEDALLAKNEEGDCYLLRLIPGLLERPVFPGSYLTMTRKFSTYSHVERADRTPMNSAQHIKVSVFADEMLPLKATLNFAPVIMGWTPIERPSSS